LRQADRGEINDDDKQQRAAKQASEVATMRKDQTIIRKRVEGEVEYNDGHFAEVQTAGIGGIEKHLILETIQISRCDTTNTPEEFQRRFPVGMRLGILTTTEITQINNPTTVT
jgi:hypothetical protein